MMGLWGLGRMKRGAGLVVCSGGARGWAEGGVAGAGEGRGGAAPLSGSEVVVAEEVEEKTGGVLAVASVLDGEGGSDAGETGSVLMTAILGGAAPPPVKQKRTLLVWVVGRSSSATGWACLALTGQS